MQSCRNGLPALPLHQVRKDKMLAQKQKILKAVEETRASGIEISNGIEDVLIAFERRFDDFCDSESTENASGAEFRQLDPQQTQELIAVRALFTDICKRLREFADECEREPKPD